MITEYEVGQIPSKALAITVKDDFGNNTSLLGYPTIEVELLGSDNEKVDLTGVTIETIRAGLGQIGVVWPKDRSLFTKKGKYLIRVVLKTNEGARDYTTTHEIRVREFGRLN